MKLTDSIKLFFFVLTIGVLFYLAVTDVYATGDCKGHSCNDGGDVSVGTNVETNVSLNSALNNTSTLNGGDMVGGDTNVSTGGNRALALSNSMGDVDLTGICQGSTQWATPLFSKQKIERDEVCVGFAWLKLGQYDLAKMHFCMDKETLAQYDSEEECEYAHDFNPVIEAAVIVEDYDEEYRMEQQMRYDALEQKIENIEPKVTQKVIQKPFLSTTQRSKLQAILDEDEE